MLHQPILATIRAALCDRIDAAAIRQQRRASPDVSMPSGLLAAGLWLTAQGYDDEPSPGETFFAWGPGAYRRYLERLTQAQRLAEVESGRRIIFEGQGARAPLLDHCTKPTDGFRRKPA
jgi:hypothetical protein